MPDILRSLEVYADNVQIAQGCRLFLYAENHLSLRPALHRLEIVDLSASSATRLAGSSYLEVRQGMSTLAMGEIMEVFSRSVSGKKITSVIFSPGIALWQSSVSLTVGSGVPTTEALRAILSASGTNIPLAAFTAKDVRLSRPQSFFGRTCDALSLLAEAAGGDAFVAPAGLCVVSRNQDFASYALPDSALLSEPIITGGHLILNTSLLGWYMGTTIEATWQGRTYKGRIISSLIQADTVSGPWKSELELE